MIRKTEFKVGLFIIVTTLLIIGSLGYVAYRKGTFSKVYTYTLSSNTAENLTEGMPVVFWGFNIGQVSSMELTDKGVLIRIKIPERNNRVIRANSRFVLDKPLLGASRIIVTTDNLKGPPLSPKVFPEITVSNDINELIKRVEPLAGKLDRIADSVATITANFADPRGEVNRILKNVETVTAHFSKKESLLEMAVGTKDSVKSIQEILSNVHGLTVSLDGILKQINTLAGKGDEEIYGRDGVFPLVRNILRDLLAKLAKIDVTLDNLNKISGETADSTKDLKLLRNNLDETVAAIGMLVDDLDRIIPFKAEQEIKLP